MTTNEQIRILLLEDAPADLALVNHELGKTGLRFSSKLVDSRESFLHELENKPPDLILSDKGVPSFDGLAALAIAREKRPDVPFIFVTNPLGEQMTIEAFQNGATDYVLKSQLGRLAPVVRRALSWAGSPAEARQKYHQLSGNEERCQGLTDAVRFQKPDRRNDCSRGGSNAAAPFEAEEALRRSEALKSEILEAVWDPIISVDGEGLIREWNPAAQRVFGYGRHEALGRPMDVLIVPSALRQVYQDGLTNYLITGVGSLLGRPIEMTLRRADGTEFSAEMAITRAPAEEPRRCTALIRDITERKRNEALIWELNTQLERRVLERTAQLEAANDELEAFSYSVSHDLQAPLRQVLGYAEILQHEAPARLTAENQGYVEKIAAAARQLEHLNNALLAFSRIGRTELREQRVSLAKLVEEARICLAHELEERTVLWQINELPDMDGDPLMLRQVVVNLISNALKFSRPRRESRIEVGALDGKHETVVFVRDNGVGFDMQCVDKLFGVFQRLHSVKQFEGTGIGLANVRRIVRRHGGRTWAEGVVDGGATFYFSLPKLLNRTPADRYNGRSHPRGSAQVDLSHC